MVMFLKLETSSFLQSSKFEIYFIMKELGYVKTLPKGVNLGVPPLRIGFWRIMGAFLEIETSSFLQSSSFLMDFIK